MLLKIRDISAKFTLLVYLISYLSISLFHYHDVYIADGNNSEVVIISHQETGGSEEETENNQCSLCLISDSQFDINFNAIPSPFLEEENHIHFFSDDILSNYDGYASQRAPPFTA